MILIDAEKISDNIQNIFMIKTTKQTKTRKILFQHNKSHL